MPKNRDSIELFQSRIDEMADNGLLRGEIYLVTLIQLEQLRELRAIRELLQANNAPANDKG